MPPLSNLAVRDLETLVHPYTNLATLRETGPLIIERAQGVFVYDTEGRAYIEGMAGLWCTALGYGNEELVEAAAVQMRKLSFGHQLLDRKSTRLNSSHSQISYAVFCLKKKKKKTTEHTTTKHQKPNMSVVT